MEFRPCQYKAFLLFWKNPCYNLDCFINTDRNIFGLKIRMEMRPVVL